ncbi:ectonucleotide pyrophosphatase/phosphodiesterase family member 5 isoform X2 [Dermochelys coriacea]|uniref:ectonucleotide pyrophosphatase/phosphodiesterase family member 5 isoform X2 n=1 Tax=Dermochelys coriacea TaxID=27794 RepID=UPI001CA7EBAA|nr:ectonucleotide pyrophosphatase/phosphodiesterase family member 5 isoform X2 [Dermochelys coriacea]
MALNCYWGVLAVCMMTFPSTLCFQQDQSRVLLLSFDGFRWDYIYKVPTPNFHYIMKNGAHVKQVTNVFITKTYPNHYTMVTGLYAESHGIVANEMYDPVLNKTFSLNSMNIYNSKFWEEACPIWVTNQMEGHRTGAAMWPGTDVKIHGVSPTHYMFYNESVSFEDRVDKLIDWFTSEEPINFGLLYWEQPDAMGHVLGPENPRMGTVISEIDDKLGYLVSELKKAKLWDTLNIIITSDHGMTQSSLERLIELDRYVARELYTMVDHSPVVAILPKEVGNHGYDNVLPEMHPIFLAYGPAFRKNTTKEAMNLTDLYPLLCHLLGISPLPNNGSFSNMEDMLLMEVPRDLNSRYYEQESYAYFIGVFLGSILVVVFLLVFIKQLMHSHLPSMQVQHSEISQPLLQG